jgi:hypothetical protein
MYLFYASYKYYVNKFTDSLTLQGPAHGDLLCHRNCQLSKLVATQSCDDSTCIVQDEREKEFK